ncbi:MAG: hypothetical protein FWE57_01610 [Chitinispirillia bacterium]|nr:hypothetical protein [Chitinispirillia bacterium]
MTQKYDLKELLKNPDTPLTEEQFENWHKYMAMTNDDKSAADVDIMPGVLERIKEMEEKGTWWF